MKKSIVFFLVISTVLFGACTSESDARRALAADGYKDVRVTGYNWFACGRDDFYHTGFEATNREGRRVTGTVCSGLLFKNATIRY